MEREDRCSRAALPAPFGWMHADSTPDHLWLIAGFTAGGLPNAYDAGTRRDPSARPPFDPFVPRPELAPSFTGGIVARAKRTDRAEARRRHRAAFADPLTDAELDGTPEGEAGDGTVSTRSTGGATSRPAGAAGAAPPPARPSISSAFRSSFRSVDLRGDLRALPQIVRHWSLWVPIILAGLSVALVPFMGPASIAGVLFGYFSGGAPFGTAFVAGLFAPRASYLVGLIAALASAGFLALAFAVGPFGGALQGLTTAAGQPLSEAESKTLLLNEALITGVPLAAIVASAGAWYRRFLNSANPNRRRPTTPPSRRPDGKVPKKQEQRPILARRR